MSTTVDLAQGAELRVGGATVGVFLSESKFRELNAERDSLRKELEQLRQEVERLRREAEEARKELDAVRSDRDQYAKSLTAVMRDIDPVMSPAEAEAVIAEAEKDGVDFGEVVRQIEEIMGGKSGGESHAG
jgi:chromosome segregation ATPase